MAGFQFKNYGTFTGPQSLSGDYNYDAVSFEIEPSIGSGAPKWATDLPTDTSFQLTDLAMVLFNNSANYTGFYCNGVATQLMTLAHSSGDIPVFRVQAKNTLVSGQVIVNDKIICNGPVIANGVLTGVTITRLDADIATAKTLPAKSFDIPHPSKEGYRLRHVSLEGPEIGVYHRGKLEDTNVIELPDYWGGLVNPDTITVNLTPVGCYQELFVETINESKSITIKNRDGELINCHYTVYGERKDLDKLIVEYEGESPRDYPGQDFLNLNVGDK